MSENRLTYKKDESYKDSLECRQLCEWVGKDKRVLEIGCHTADLGKEIKKNGNYVVGIDYNKEAINIAKNVIQEAYVLDLETEEVFFCKTDKFDVVVCNQVLEHLRNPDDVLTKIKKILHPNGYLIVGLPNVCNAKDRFNITWGKWEYTETGVMDKTHIHFFSYNSAYSFLLGNNLKITDYKSFWQVDPIWELLDHIPFFCKLCKFIDEHKPWRCFARNLTDVVMIFKCEKK